MIVLGLTGSIAMGKSTAAAMFRRLGVPVYDADHAVHRLMEKGGLAVPIIEAAFPGAIQNGAVDRSALGVRVFSNAAALAQLEGILHPLVARQREAFLGRARSERRPLVVLDIPLLFETGGERLCDAVVVVSAPAWLQYARLRRREGMSRERIAAILRRQMPDAEKRRRADFVIPTGRSKGATYAAIRRLVSTLLRRQSAEPRESRPQPPRYLMNLNPASGPLTPSLSRREREARSAGEGLAQLSITSYLRDCERQRNDAAFGPSPRIMKDR